jgi:predicted homoserine dehydrogenase-like protein
MFNSFLDGTKSAIEMAAIANATGLTPPPDGLGFPPCGMDDLAQVLRPAGEGGVLHQKGQVEVVGWADVEIDSSLDAVRARCAMETRFGQGSRATSA